MSVMHFFCPNCHHGLRSLTARLDGNPIWRCYGCQGAFIYLDRGWREIPAPPVKVRPTPVRVDHVQPAKRRTA